MVVVQTIVPLGFLFFQVARFARFPRRGRRDWVVDCSVVGRALFARAAGGFLEVRFGLQFLRGVVEYFVFIDCGSSASGDLDNLKLPVLTGLVEFSLVLSWALTCEVWWI